MSHDPVVLALRAALAAGDSIEIRLALAGRFMAVGDPTAALAEYEAALALVATSREALEGAAQAADASGDAAKAAAYRLALGSMPAAVAPPSPATPVSSPPTAKVPTSLADPGAGGPKLRLVTDEAADEADDEERPTIGFADIGG